MNQLKKNAAFGGPEGPVVLVIMDGVGIGKYPESDYVKIANTCTVPNTTSSRHR
jgi:2,3-bisphosphoglycerate-independent phosphoglycerate mutase